jgi:hypothetical protein
MFVGSLLVASALGVGAIVFGAVACSTSDLRSGLSSPAADSPEELLADLKRDKDRIDQLTDAMAEKVTTFNASRGQGEATLRLSDVFYEDLSPSERDVLGTLIEAEQDVSYKALLQTLARDRETIQTLQERVLAMEQTLPDQYVVAAKGDSHTDLATNYLTAQAGLDTETARKVLSTVDLSDELVPGNRVWFFYDADREAFRTYVTQGDAGMMPSALRRAMKRTLTTERDSARALAEDLEQTRRTMETEISSLNGDIQALQSRRTSLETEVAGLSSQRDWLEDRVEDLSAALAENENSLFFHAASEQELKERGVITKVRKKFSDAQGVQYDRALDLTRGTKIHIDASDLGLQRIDKISLLPEVFHPDRDYVIERSADGTEATMTILEPDIFRGKEVILAVQG